MKRYMSPMNSSRLKDFKKHFGFCCDICHQNSGTQYDICNPPYESSFAEAPLVTNRPDIQFRVQDNVKTPPRLVPRVVGEFKKDVEMKKAATYGKPKRGRGPLRWFLEDEIEAARDILAAEKKANWEQMHDMKTNKSRIHRSFEKTNSVTDDESRTISASETGSNETK